jgi:hypothetical protein
VPNTTLNRRSLVALSSAALGIALFLLSIADLTTAGWNLVLRLASIILFFSGFTYMLVFSKRGG